MRSTVQLSCSFCGKSQHEVRKLISGPTVYICDECVKLCNDILAEEPKLADPAPEGPSRRTEQEGRQVSGRKLCSFCGKTQHEVRNLIAAKLGPCICDECIGLCNDVIAEEIDRLERAERAAVATLPGDVRALIAGILERGLPAAERVLAVLRKQGPGVIANPSATLEDSDKRSCGPADLAGGWKYLYELVESPASKEIEVPQGVGPAAKSLVGLSGGKAEVPGWVQPIIERLSATLEFLELLARRLEEPGLEELRPSFELAGEKLNEAVELLLSESRRS